MRIEFTTQDGILVEYRDGKLYLTNLQKHPQSDRKVLVKPDWETNFVLVMVTTE